ncbi:MAG TPA: hypothetical protein VMR37_05380 [Rhabdochlamydiaceae bacterium]|nr:hypothetical protein [Rhabdochlamydiaceae bacterium]
MGNQISAISSPINRALSYLPQSSLWNNRVVALIGIAGAVGLVALAVYHFFRQAPTPPSGKGPSLKAPTATASSSSPSAPPSVEPTRTATTPAAAPSQPIPQTVSTALAEKPVDAFFAQLCGDTANAKADPNFEESALGIFRISTEGLDKKSLVNSTFPIFSWLCIPPDGLKLQSMQPATRVNDTLEAVVRLPLRGRVQLGVVARGGSPIEEVPAFEVEQRSAIYDFYFKDGKWFMRTETRDLPQLVGRRFPRLHFLGVSFSFTIASSGERTFRSPSSSHDFYMQNETEDLHILSFEIEGTVQVQKWEANGNVSNTIEKRRLSIPIVLPPGSKLPLRKSFWEESYIKTLGSNHKLLNSDLTLLSIQDSATADVGMMIQKITLS